MWPIYTTGKRSREMNRIERLRDLRAAFGFSLTTAVHVHNAMYPAYRINVAISISKDKTIVELFLALTKAKMEVHT